MAARGGQRGWWYAPGMNQRTFRLASAMGYNGVGDGADGKFVFGVGWWADLIR
ncbi:MAG: hypothetical protein H6659_11430 [Ardenticatenaceae bacterium]|nr:hypothetical protein [Ardenticatenaceae bacterium]